MPLNPASRNGPRTHIDAIACRMIENTKTVEFIALSANSNHGLTLAVTRIQQIQNAK